MHYSPTYKRILGRRSYRPELNESMTLKPSQSCPSFCGAERERSDSDLKIESEECDESNQNLQTGDDSSNSHHQSQSPNIPSVINRNRRKQSISPTIETYESESKTITYEPEKRTVTYEFESRTATYEPESRTVPSSKSNQFYLTLFYLPIIFVLIYIICTNISVPPATSKSYEPYIKELKQKFPSQSDDFWSTILSGLENVIERNKHFKTTVFLFLKKNSSDNTAFELSQRIAQLAVKSLGTKKAMIISQQDLNDLPAEKGYFIEFYRKSLEENKVLLIQDLNKVPHYIAESLHYVCDSENPLVEKSVIILIMDVPHLASKNKTVLETVEDILFKLWSPPLKDNVIYPIITRLTGSAVEIIPEPLNSET